MKCLSQLLPWSYFSVHSVLKDTANKNTAQVRREEVHQDRAYLLLTTSPSAIQHAPNQTRVDKSCYQYCLICYQPSLYLFNIILINIWKTHSLGSYPNFCHQPSCTTPTSQNHCEASWLGIVNEGLRRDFLSVQWIFQVRRSVGRTGSTLYT